MKEAEVGRCAWMFPIILATLQDFEPLFLPLFSVIISCHYKPLGSMTHLFFGHYFVLHPAEQISGGVLCLTCLIRASGRFQDSEVF